MRTLIAILLTFITFASIAQAHPDREAEVAMKRFPGFSQQQMSRLLKAKKRFCVPLPTWCPGFAAEKVDVFIDPKARQDSWRISVTYSRTTADKTQRFRIEAGLEGIGDLLYESTHVVKTPIGRLGLCYEPKDENGKRLWNYVRTQWFDCNGTAWAYGSCRGMAHGGKTVMIPLEETRKILASLQKL